MKIEIAKRKFPIGKLVKYYPIKGIDSFKTVEVCSEPWVVGGEVVVKVTGVRGCVSVDHLIG